ncbi:hypothetical protein LAZ67_16001936 [Cordylochernes scorpioides]|uniref:RNA-directed DNA polymerase n=1 Tax=Cordylochernes scorpioides TaxID=51811 RepID=A0ABY6LBJ5_9ARAC|nr:hypothetical protein LAZ67_16001936 [Cordylochernes scorpioides]
MKKTRSNTTMIEQTHNQVPQEPTTDATVAASLRTLTLCLDQLLNRESEETITYDGDEPAAHFFSQLESQPNFHNLEPARQARKALSSLRGEPRKIAQDLALLNKTYEEVKESLCAVYPRLPSFTLQEFYELKCTSMAEIETYYKNKVRIGLAINLPKSAIVQALSNGVPRNYGNLLKMAQPSGPEEWLCLAQQLTYEGDNTSTKAAQQRSPRQSRTPSTTVDKTPPYPCRYCGGQHWHAQSSSNPKDRLGLQVSTRPQQRRAREKPSNASFGSRTPKLNEPTCTLNQHTPKGSHARSIATLPRRASQVYSNKYILTSLRLSAYDYEVKYLKGSRQYEADLLSRNPFCGFLSTGQIKDHQGELRRDTRYILNDKDLMTIIRRGVTKIIVPPSLRGTLLQRAHRDFNHPGISQMTRLIAAQYYWDGMTNDIRTHVRTCSVCQLVEPPKGPFYGELGQLPPAVLPYELVSLDTISGFAKYGNSQTFLHVVVDHATRYAWAFPSRSTSILTYTQVIKKVMQFGSPKRLLTDRAPAFTSPKFRRFLIRHNIGQLLTTSNNPQANGLSERLNATITGKLKLLRLQQPKTAWTKLLPQVLQAYNHTPHSVTGFPPSYLLLGMNQILSNSDVFTPAIAEEQTLSNSKYKKELRTLCRNKIITTDELQGFLSNLHGQAYIYGLPKVRPGRVRRIAFPTVPPPVVRLRDTARSDLKPTQLLRKMRTLKTDKDISEKVLQTLWMDKMPEIIKNILVVSEEGLDKLAEIADKIQEMNPRLQVKGTKNKDPAFEEMTATIASLKEEIATLKLESRTRQNRRSYSPRPRERSRSRRYNPDGKYCYFHYRFGNLCRPDRCTSPCQWKKPSGNSIPLTEESSPKVEELPKEAEAIAQAEESALKFEELTKEPEETIIPAEENAPIVEETPKEPEETLAEVKTSIEESSTLLQDPIHEIPEPSEQGTDSKMEENLDAEQGTESKVEEKMIDPKDWFKRIQQDLQPSRGHIFKKLNFLAEFGQLDPDDRSQTCPQIGGGHRYVTQASVKLKLQKTAECSER